MKTFSNHLTRIITIAATAAAGFMIQGAAHAQDQIQVVTLAPVIVTGKRVPVIEFERVVVTGKRLAPATTVVAERNAVAKKV